MFSVKGTELVSSVVDHLLNINPCNYEAHPRRKNAATQIDLQKHKVANVRIYELLYKSACDLNNNSDMNDIEAFNYILDNYNQVLEHATVVHKQSISGATVKQYSDQCNKNTIQANKCNTLPSLHLYTFQNKSKCLKTMNHLNKQYSIATQIKCLKRVEKLSDDLRNDTIAVSRDCGAYRKFGGTSEGINNARNVKTLVSIAKKHGKKFGHSQASEFCNSETHNRPFANVAFGGTYNAETDTFSRSSRFRIQGISLAPKSVATGSPYDMLNSLEHTLFVNATGINKEKLVYINNKNHDFQTKYYELSIFLCRYHARLKYLFDLLQAIDSDELVEANEVIQKHVNVAETLYKTVICLNDYLLKELGRHKLDEKFEYFGNCQTLQISVTTQIQLLMRMIEMLQASQDDFLCNYMDDAFKIQENIINKSINDVHNAIFEMCQDIVRHIANVLDTTDGGGGVSVQEKQVE